MSKIQLYLALLIFIMGCRQSGIGQDIIDQDSTNETTIEAKSNTQLEININALLKDPNEQLRIKAASLMLNDENPLAREILIDALRNSDNSAARKAVCKMLIQARSSLLPIRNKEDFLQPLLGIFSTEIEEEAELAAQAILLYEYSEIGESLEKLVKDSQQPVQTRKNAIGALKLPEINAIVQLYNLVDDLEEQIASEAKQALQSLGFPIGSNSVVREQFIADLMLKGKDEFLREWVNLQDTQIRGINTDKDWWQQFSLDLLSGAYQNFTDNAEQKGEFLVEYLSSPKAAIKLWALEQVYQWRVSSSSNLPRSELESALINLISDPDKNVRLKTAETLALISTMDSASPLLEQLGLEQDKQVKVKLLEALGSAGSEASLQDPAVSVSPEIKQIRTQALELAETFLNGESPDEVRTGAEVIQKLLKGNGFEPEQVNMYIGLLLSKYEQQNDEAEGSLRADLLSNMTGLIKQDSACRTAAIALFETVLQSSLNDESDIIRETAAKGLGYIDKASALAILRQNHTNDTGPIIKLMISYAVDVRSREDLNWLVEKIGTNSEISKLAWPAIIAVLKDFNADNLHIGPS
ncbi:HEAT repeat domain-containing protein [Planctomycetota bacterium]